MKTKEMLEFDFLEAKGQARKLREVVASLQKVVADLDTNMNNISGNWSGDNASKFLRKEAAVTEHLRTQIERLSTAADEIDETAQEIYRREMRALQIAEESSSGNFSGDGGNAGGGGGGGSW